LFPEKPVAIELAIQACPTRSNFGHKPMADIRRQDHVFMVWANHYTQEDDIDDNVSGLLFKGKYHGRSNF